MATYYPNSGTGGPTGDATTSRQGVNESFATIRGDLGAGTNVFNTDAQHFLLLLGSATTDKFEELHRVVLTFDTSALPSSAVITSATLSIKGTGKSSGVGSPDLHVVKFVGSNSFNFAASDHNNANHETNDGGSITYANFSTSAYNNIALNATGIGMITKQGITKLMLLLSWDLTGSFTGTWASGGLSQFSFYAADQADTTEDPYLTIEYYIFNPQITIIKTYT